MGKKTYSIARIPLSDGREIIKRFDDLEIKHKKEKDGAKVTISQTVKTFITKGN